MLSDFVAGFNATVAILAALHYKEKTGEGQHIDISMQDCIWALVAVEYLPRLAMSGKVPARLGNAAPLAIPFNTYLTKDGYVAIGVATVGQWQSLLNAMGRADLIGVPKYATQNDRVKCREEVEAIVSEWTKSKTIKEVVNALMDAKIPCSPVLNVEQVLQDPQILSRDMIIEVEQLVSGKIKVPGSVFKLSKTPGDSNSAAPFLGQHNYEVYSELLGYSEQDIKKLQDDGVI